MCRLYVSIYIERETERVSKREREILISTHIYIFMYVGFYV